MFMKIEGIDGESQDSKHKNEIDVLAWSWGVSQSGLRHVGGGGGAGKANFQDLSFTKFIDKSTPDLMLHCASGKHIDKATLTARTNDPRLEEYLVITLKDVFVSSYRTGADDGAGRAKDHISLRYADYIQQVFTFDPAGDVTGEFEVFWNVPTNTGGGNNLVTNTAPTITAVPDQTTTEDGPAVTVNFTISDAETPAGALILGRSSAVPSLVPNENIVFGGSGTSRSATITPAPDQFGSTDIILTVSDGSMSVSTSFTLDVIAGNDPPSIGSVGTQVTGQGVPLDVAVPLDDVDDDPAGLVLTATSSNQALLPDPNITIPAAGNPRVVTLNPLPGAFGEATVTLTAQDDGGLTSPPVDFLLIVNASGGGGGFDSITVNGQPGEVPIVLAENSPSGTPLGILET
ncbi:MAG: type VI secretion system tube protein Hcp, partial [Akkermansiaceae bacterium]|nr:type VI secretion system tube protein Hcp [Akkermansiaceae bacterium]